MREQISILALLTRDLRKMLSQDGVMSLAFTQKLRMKRETHSWTSQNSKTVSITFINSKETQLYPFRNKSVRSCPIQFQRWTSTHLPYVTIGKTKGFFIKLNQVIKKLEFIFQSVKLRGWLLCLCFDDSAVFGQLYMSLLFKIYLNYSLNFD